MGAPAGIGLLRCGKNFPHPDGDQAAELLLIRHPELPSWDVKPRCAAHPAAADIPLLHKINPSLICVIVPLGGAS